MRAHIVFVIAALGACEAEAPEPLVQPSDALERMAGFAGEYVVVDVRRASDVAAPAQIGMDSPLGETIRFTPKGIEMSGADCDAWTISQSSAPIVPYQSDPNLIDVTLGPTDSPISVGDRQIHAGYVAQCEGEDVLQFHKVDNRVLLMPTANGAVNLILERPLTATQIKAYQMQLKSVKYYDGPLSGVLDEKTLRASRFWYEDRARLADDQPIPARPAITENLLDALRVLNGSDR